jgi:three-Cys-motif partner protein
MKVPWAREPHTAAKHRVLERYLQAWWPIMLSRFPRVTYVEGFAGPGVYTGGEPGSPIIAMEALRNAAAPSKPVDLIFIDREPRCLAMLAEQIAAKFGSSVRPGVQAPHLVRGTAAELLLPQLDAVAAWQGGVFAFLDSWGNVAVPLDVVAEFARPGGEVIVTIGRRFWRQFGGVVGPEWDAMFGSAAWRAVESIPSAAAQARFIADTYRAALRSVGFGYLLDFELISERGDYLYLIHATTHAKGLEKMKEAIWSVDPVAGAGFRDPRDLGGQQQALDLEWQPNVAPLRQMIIEWLGTGPRTLEDLSDRAFFDTIYRRPHARAAVTELVRDGLLHRSPPSGRLVPTTLLSKP